MLAPNDANYEIEKHQDSARDIKLHLVAWPLRLADTASQKEKFLLIPQGHVITGLNITQGNGQGRNTLTSGFAATGNFSKFNWYFDAFGGFWGQAS